MANRETYNREQFEKAGEQAAQVLGRFVSLAAELSNEFTRKADNDFQQSKEAEDQKSDAGNVDILREAGEELQKMREAAGYTLDSFAAALKTEINRTDIDDSDVVVKVEAAESGREPLPRDWLSQVAALLNSRDPKQFADRTQRSHDAHDASGGNFSSESQGESMQAVRARKFSAIFEGDDDLTDCTEDQFNKLLGFVEKNYLEAKNLVVGK